MVFHLPCRGIYQIRRGICQILPRKTVGPTDYYAVQVILECVLSILVQPEYQRPQRGINYAICVEGSHYP